MKTPRFLLIGIGGVYNYGCEAIVRGTEHILHKPWPEAEVIYASFQPETDRKRLHDCRVEIILRTGIARYSPRNVLRKLLSLVHITWRTITDLPAMAEGYDAVLSIGGDIFTIRPNNLIGNRGFLRFGVGCERRGIPYVLWGASVGPFSQNPRTEKFFASHLKKISLITAREQTTIDYLQSLGINKNVIACADSAYIVASEIKAGHLSRTQESIIGINLSPLSARHAGIPMEQSILTQARTIQELIARFHARIILIPHVVCDFREEDDDLRYLCRIKQAIASEYQESISLLDNDLGFIGTKKEIIKCDLIIAARMHCAINALAAHVPTLLISYSRKAEGMCRFVYGNQDWVIPLQEFQPDPICQKVQRLISQTESMRDYLAKRIPEIQKLSFQSVHALQNLLEIRSKKISSG